MENFESAAKAEPVAFGDSLSSIRNLDQRILLSSANESSRAAANDIFGSLELTGLSGVSSDSKSSLKIDGDSSILADKPQLIARVSDAEVNKLSNAFDVKLAVMTDSGHHIPGFGWAQNFDESRKCYSQASEMGLYLRRVVANQGMSGYLSVDMGTINEGKGADPRDFYTGNGEHNFIVITDKRDGSKLYADPWQGINFTRDAQKITGGKPVTINDFNR